MEAATDKAPNLALQLGSSLMDMELENWAMPDRSSLACLCSLLPASRDTSCTTVGIFVGALHALHH